MLGRRVSGIQYVRWIPKWSRRYVRPTGTGRTVGVFLAFQLSLKKNLDASDSVGDRSIKIQVYSINNGGFLPDMILLTLCYFFFFFHLTCYSRRASTLPSCLRSLRISLSLPGSRLTNYYRDASSSALLQLVNQSMVEFRNHRGTPLNNVMKNYSLSSMFPPKCFESFFRIGVFLLVFKEKSERT